MEKKKIKKIADILIDFSIITGIVFISFKCGQNSLMKKLVDIEENNKDDILYIDPKTHLIYNIMAECIGD